MVPGRAPLMQRASAAVDLVVTRVEAWAQWCGHPPAWDERYRIRAAGGSLSDSMVGSLLPRMVAEGAERERRERQGKDVKRLPPQRAIVLGELRDVVSFDQWPLAARQAYRLRYGDPHRPRDDAAWASSIHGEGNRPLPPVPSGVLETDAAIARLVRPLYEVILLEHWSRDETVDRRALLAHLSRRTYERYRRAAYEQIALELAGMTTR